MQEKIISKEELNNRYKHHLTMGGLRKFIEENKNLSDDVKVVAERVEDVYFENHNWGVLLKKGLMYFQMERMNEKMRAEIERREKGEEPEYTVENPKDFIAELNEDLMEQYIPPWAITTDGEVVYVHNHS